MNFDWLEKIEVEALMTNPLVIAGLAIVAFFIAIAIIRRLNWNLVFVLAGVAAVVGLVVWQWETVMAAWASMSATAINWTD